MERNNRKVYTGTVISTKMDKTITVLVETHVKHKLYGKRMNSSKKSRVLEKNSLSKSLLLIFLYPRYYSLRYIIPLF